MIFYGTRSICLIRSLLAVRLASGPEKCPTQDHTTIADLDVTRSISLMTVNHWLTGHSLMAQRESIERLKNFLSAHA